MLFFYCTVAILTSFAVSDALREASDEEFPFQVSIQTLAKRHLCGGAIIAPNWVLTASSCVAYPPVIVSYGSADSNNPQDSITSQKIEYQTSFTPRTKNRLALVQLQRSIQFSKTAQQAKLPTSRVQLRNTTKLCGWRVSQTVDVPPNLYVSDSYFVVPKDCKRSTGAPVILAVDEFCGIEEELRNTLFNPGSIVSKEATVLGILSEALLTANEPLIYVKISEYEEWIKNVLGSDAQYVHWVNDVPKDSSPQHYVNSLAVVGIFAVFLRLLA